MSAITENLSERLTPALLALVMKGAGARAIFDKGFKDILYHDVGNGREPWNAKVVFKTKDGRHARHVIIKDGRVKSGKGAIADPDVSFILKDLSCMKKMLVSSPEDAMGMLLQNELTFEGNMAVVTRFSYVLNRLTGKGKPELNPKHDWLYNSELEAAGKPLPMERCDEVKYLDDPAFSKWDIDDFPRLKGFLKDFFGTRPTISTERPMLLTEHFKKHGFEKTPDGEDRDPELGGRSSATAT